jgi:hypothetical protein
MKTLVHALVFSLLKALLARVESLEAARG